MTDLITRSDDERLSKIEAEWDRALNSEREETRLVAQVVTYLLRCLRAALKSAGEGENGR